MHAHQPTTLLFEKALERGLPMSPATLAAAMDHLRGMDTVATGLPLDVGELYSRPELDAATAADIKSRFLGRFTHGVPPELAVKWQARELLRPESHPEQVTAADVARWPEDVAVRIGSWCRFRQHLVPQKLAVLLCDHPNLNVAASAIARVSDQTLIERVVDRVGTAAAASCATKDRLLTHACALVAGWEAPPAAVVHAARTWTSPLALASVDVRRLPQDALERVVALWMLPRMAAASIEPEYFVTASLAVLRGTDDDLKVRVRDAWLATGALARFEASVKDGDDDGDLEALRTKFADAGLPLERPLLERPYTSAVRHGPQGLRQPVHRHRRPHRGVS